MAATAPPTHHVAADLLVPADGVGREQAAQDQDPDRGTLPAVSERSLPVVAVVVSTYNRAALLPRLVRALERQQGAPPFEVVLVDDCSPDDTATVLEQLRGSTTLAMRTLRTETNRGPAAGRNLGWRSTQAPIIAFTDDDCVPQPDWLARLVASLEHVDIVQGRTSPDPGRAADRGPFARMMCVEEQTPYFETCNIAYRRELLARLDGFDESFRRPFGEDADLGWRALESGASVAWAPDAAVIHDVERTTHLRDWVAWMRDVRRREFAPLMVKRHPGLRAHQHWRWFYQASHPLVLLSIAGLAAIATQPSSPRHRRAAAASIVPWLVYRTAIQPRPARRRNWWAVLPMTYAGDVLEVAVLIRGSVRHRALLL